MEDRKPPSLFQPLKELMHTSREDTRRQNRILTKSIHPAFLIFVVLVSLPFLLIGISVGWNNARLSLFGGRTEGMITAVREKWENRAEGQEVAYYPTFEFATSDGKKVSVDSNSGLSGDLAFMEGEKIAVAYDPKNPENAVINDGRMWIFPSVFTGMGILFLAASIVLAWKRYKFRKEDGD